MNSNFLRVEIIVKGEVQRVNFRDIVREFAKECRVFGFVENIDNLDEDVRIVAEGPKENLEKFLQFLQKLKEEVSTESNIEELPRIEEIIIKNKKPTGKYVNFKIIRKQDEIGERMIKAYDVLVKIHSTLQNFRTESKQEFKNLSDKLDIVAENSFDHKLLTEEHKQITMEFKEENSKNFQTLFDKTSEHKQVTEKLVEESAEYKNITENFRNESNKNFDRLDIKYGKVSEKLSDLTETIKDSNKKLDEIGKVKEILERIEKKFD